MKGSLVILKKCLKINWFPDPWLYSDEAKMRSQDGEFPTVTPFISGKLSHLMICVSTAHWPIFPQTAPESVFSSRERHTLFHWFLASSGRVWMPVFPSLLLGLDWPRQDGLWLQPSVPAEFLHSPYSHCGECWNRYGRAFRNGWRSKDGFDQAAKPCWVSSTCIRMHMY